MMRRRRRKRRKWRFLSRLIPRLSSFWRCIVREGVEGARPRKGQPVNWRVKLEIEIEIDKADEDVEDEEDEEARLRRMRTLETLT